MNISKILEFAPRGLRLYSPICGQVTLYDVSQENIVVKSEGTGMNFTFLSDGKMYPDGEVTLFPAREHTSWNCWQKYILFQNPGIVVVDTKTNYHYLVTGVYSLADTNNNVFFIDTLDMDYFRYATEEEAREFLKQNDYTFDTSSKSVVRNTKQTTKFTPGDWVVDEYNQLPDYQLFEILDVQKFYYVGVTQGGLEVAYPISKQNKLRKWTIHDAQDGDFLCYEDPDTQGYLIWIAQSDPREKYAIYGDAIGFNTDSCHVYDPSEVDRVRPATKDRIGELLSEIEKHGLDWNPVSHEIYDSRSNCLNKPGVPEEIPDQTSKLKPFDRVLVRDYAREEWKCNLFSRYVPDALYPFQCICGNYKQCLPYNVETQDLLGTNTAVED